MTLPDGASSGTLSAETSEELEDLRNRLELAVQDIRELKGKNADLQTELSKARKAAPASGASAMDAGLVPGPRTLAAWDRVEGVLGVATPVHQIRALAAAGSPALREPRRPSWMHCASARISCWPCGYPRTPRWTRR